MICIFHDWQRVEPSKFDILKTAEENRKALLASSDYPKRIKDKYLSPMYGISLFLATESQYWGDRYVYDEVCLKCGKKKHNVQKALFKSRRFFKNLEEEMKLEMDRIDQANKLWGL